MNEKISFTDTTYIYFSPEDCCWVAHSLRTDQVGYGQDVVTALTDVIRAVDAVCKLAQEDETIAFLREAPDEIQVRARLAKKLPGELYEIAHKQARGEWPTEILTTAEPRKSEAFVMEAEESVC